MYLKFFTLFLIIFVVSLTAGAAKIIVGPEERVKTIKVAIALAHDGDTLIIRPGIYKEGNIAITKSLFILGSSMPVIDAEEKYENITVTAHRVTVDGLHLKNTGISSMNDLSGIGAEDVRGITIRNCLFENTYFAIHISNSNNIHIENNTMRAYTKAEHQTGNGIHLWKCTDARINHNNVFHHRDGIYFEFVTNSTIESNYCQGNLRYGLHFMFSHHNIYKKNTFKNNGAGVAVMYTHHVEMYENRFEDNWGSAAYGLLLKDISDSYIEENVFLKNTIAIFIEGTNRSSFSKNIFKENGWAVKLQANCEDNSFTYNNFRGNSFDVVTNGTLVLTAFQHNYWDKYQGYDLDRNGIGDVPFRPVSMYAMVIDRIPESVLLWRSFLVFLLDKTERVVPAMIPENLKDDYPTMKAHDFAKNSQ